MRFFGFVLFVVFCASPAPGQLVVGAVPPMASITETTPVGNDRRVLMVGPRNGSATGVVLVRSAAGRPLNSLQVSHGQVVHEENRALDIGKILEIHYATRREDLGPGASDSTMPYYDTLSPKPVDDGAFQVVVLHVPIPSNAPPGRYRGRLMVSATGGRVELPLDILVSDFLVPPPRERMGWVDMLQSPDSVAYRYKVPLYSQRHLELLEPSMRMLGRLGQRSMMVQVLAQTNFGNDESMIPADASRIDFSGYEGYLNLFDEHVGEPEFVIAYVVEKGGNDGVPHWTPPGGPRDGTTDAEPVDYSPALEGPWRELLAGMVVRFRRIGWRDARLVLGWVGDDRDYMDLLEFFGRAAPGIEWVQFTHARGDPDPRDGELNVAGMPVAMRVLPYRPKGDHISTGGWDSRFLQLSGLRESVAQESSLTNYRRIPGYSVSRTGRDRAYRGFSRLGLDFWQVDIPGEGRGVLLKRFARWHNLQRFLPRAIVAPGPGGALPTLRYLNLWEGIQENEAALRIERAVKEGNASPEAEEAAKAWRNALPLVKDKDPAPEIPPDYFETVYNLYQAAAGLRTP